MKKLILLSTLLFIGYTAQSQISFGAKAGFNGGLGKTEIDLPGAENEKSKMLPSFHVGGFVDFGLSQSFSIQPGLTLNGRGSRYEHEGHHDDLRIMSLDLPVNFLYRNSGFFVGGGPSVGYGLSAKLHEDDHAHEGGGFSSGGGGDHDEDKIKFGSKPGELKPINIGLNLLAGYELRNGLFFSAGYLADFTNWSNAEKVTSRYSFFSVSAGFRFNKKTD